MLFLLNILANMKHFALYSVLHCKVFPFAILYRVCNNNVELFIDSCNLDLFLVLFILSLILSFIFFCYFYSADSHNEDENGETVAKRNTRSSPSNKNKKAAPSSPKPHSRKKLERKKRSSPIASSKRKSKKSKKSHENGMFSFNYTN